MKRVLICIYGDISKQPRVLMEIDAPKKNFEVICAGFGDAVIEGTTHINIEKIYPPDYLKVDFLRTIPLWSVRFLYRYSKFVHAKTHKEIYDFENTVDFVSNRLYNALKKNNPDVLIIHHPALLPLGSKFIDKGVAVILNAHEYYPEVLGTEKEWDDKYKPGIINQLKKYLPKINCLFTISEGIQLKYKKEFNINSFLVTNAKPLYNLLPKKPGNIIKLVHHGSSIPIRNLEETINVINFLPENYTLDLYMFPAYKDYHDSLVNLYKDNPRVKFNAIVPTEDLPRILNQYDIGLCMFPPVNFNLEMTLPNKFFEFVQARNAIVAGPSPELNTYIKKYDLGMITEDFTTKSLANSILSLTPEKIFYFKEQCNKHAKELSYEKELETISFAVNTLIKNKRSKLPSTINS